MKKNEIKIARWNIDSPVERFLGSCADSIFAFRRLYVLYYKIFDADYYKNGLKMANKQIDKFVNVGGYVCSQSERDRYLVDMVYSLHRFGCMFDEYFLFSFENKSYIGRKSYITDKIRYNYYFSLNKDRDLFRDKYRTYEALKSFYKREVIQINDLSQLEEFKMFISNHNRFIVKPQSGDSGKGVEIYDIDSNLDVEQLLNRLLENGSVVIEELIQQVGNMSKLHPTSVNTLRIITIKIKDEVVVWHPLLRIGRGGSIVDNASSGGIFACVDKSTGVVLSRAYDEQGNIYLKHPDTDVVFPGLQIPEWDKCLQLVKELAKKIDTNLYISWDMAFSDKGWVLVEGNTYGQVVMQQIVEGYGFKNELDEIVSKMEK